MVNGASWVLLNQCFKAQDVKDRDAGGCFYCQVKKPQQLLL